MYGTGPFIYRMSGCTLYGQPHTGAPGPPAESALPVSRCFIPVVHAHRSHIVHPIARTPEIQTNRHRAEAPGPGRDPGVSTQHHISHLTPRAPSDASGTGEPTLRPLALAPLTPNVDAHGVACPPRGLVYTAMPSQAAMPPRPKRAPPPLGCCQATRRQRRRRRRRRAPRRPRPPPRPPPSLAAADLAY